MRVLIVFCHPNPESYGASLLATARAALEGAGHETRLIDLYAEGFDPTLGREELALYEDPEKAHAIHTAHIEALRWCEGLVFVYPTWWYGLPAMLKGWLDRVWLPDVAFTMPRPNETIRPKLQHIRRLAVVTTCGASWWLTRWVGAPGKALLLRGCGVLMKPGAKKVYLAHYLMDSSTPESRERFRGRVRKAMAAF